MGWMGMWMARNVVNATGRHNSGPPSVTELSEGDQRQLQDLIDTQLAALRAHDAESAWEGGTRAFKTHTGSPKRYYDLLSAGYRPVLEAERVQQGPYLLTAHGLAQELTLCSEAHGRRAALFLVRRSLDGAWRHNGFLMLDHAVDHAEA